MWEGEWTHYKGHLEKQTPLDCLGVQALPIVGKKVGAFLVLWKDA